MEPTIYKPSIYKGAGIYKIGAEGGGGGGIDQEIYTILSNGLYKKNGQSSPYFDLATPTTNENKITLNLSTSGIVYRNGVYPYVLSANGIFISGPSYAPTTYQSYEARNSNYGYSKELQYNTTFLPGVLSIELEQSKGYVNNKLIRNDLNYSIVNITRVYPCGNDTTNSCWSNEIGTIEIKFGTDIDLIAVKRIEDNVKGFFDVVNGNFYPVNSLYER